MYRGSPDLQSRGHVCQTTPSPVHSDVGSPGQQSSRCPLPHSSSLSPALSSTVTQAGPSPELEPDNRVDTLKTLYRTESVRDKLSLLKVKSIH